MASPLFTQRRTKHREPGREALPRPARAGRNRGQIPHESRSSVPRSRRQVRRNPHIGVAPRLRTRTPRVGEEHAREQRGYALPGPEPEGAHGWVSWADWWRTDPERGSAESPGGSELASRSPRREPTARSGGVRSPQHHRPRRPSAAAGWRLLFAPLADRYERRSVAITSNLVVSQVGPDLPGPDDHRRRDRRGRAPLGDPRAQRQALIEPGQPTNAPGPRVPARTPRARGVVTAVRDPRTTARAPRSRCLCGQPPRSSPTCPKARQQPENSRSSTLPTRLRRPAIPIVAAGRNRCP